MLPRGQSAGGDSCSSTTASALKSLGCLGRYRKSSRVIKRIFYVHLFEAISGVLEENFNIVGEFGITFLIDGVVGSHGRTF